MAASTDRAADEGLCAGRIPTEDPLVKAVSPTTRSCLLASALVLAGLASSTFAQHARPRRASADELEASCVAGRPSACDELVRRVRTPLRRATPDDPRARWLSLACDFGSRSACFTLGDAFATGSPLAEAPYFERTRTGADVARAARLYAEACALGEPRACEPAIESFRATDAPCEAARVEARACVGSRPPRACATRDDDERACAARHAIPRPPPEATEPAP